MRWTFERALPALVLYALCGAWLAAQTTAQGPGPAEASAVPEQPPNADTEDAKDAQDAAATAAVLALDPASSTSIGAPTAGALRGAVALPERGVGFVRNPKRPAQARYGTVELVQALVRAAAIVDQEFPASRLVVNDLGLEDGGPVAQHGSHQSGRDADVLFYALDVHGQPMAAVGVPIEPDGRGWDFKRLSDPADDVRVRLDVRRTWRFMQALIEVAGDELQRIFIAEHVRSLLLAEAGRRKAPRRVVERFEQLTCQPGSPHDDHMHVRLHCSVQDMAEGCTDSLPLYPWRRRALSERGVEPAIARPQRDAKQRREVRARTTTPAEARARAGPMHRKVREFLERRKAWLEAPHPGRPFCR